MISLVWSIAQLQDLRAMLSEAMLAGASIDDLISEIDDRIGSMATAPPKTPSATLTMCPSCGHGYLYQCPYTGAMVCNARCGYSRMGK